MSRRIFFKTILCVSIISLFIFCGIQVFSEGVVTPIKGGKVPVDYLEPDAYSAKRLAEGKAMFEAKCALCHTDSGRDMVYFGFPDFNSARVAGSVKKFVGAATDPEIGEKVYEYLRYNNDGPFMTQEDPFLQPGPLGLGPEKVNPILTKDDDFWGALTGHKVPTPDDVNLDKIWDSYDMSQVVLPYSIVTWAEYMPNSVPLKAAVDEIRTLFNKQRYNLNNLPLPDKGLGRMFNYSAQQIYKKYQFSSHAYNKTDFSKDTIDAVYSTSMAKWLGVLDFEYGLPQRVNNEWNGEWAFGPYENTILWEPGENLKEVRAFAINENEKIMSREAMRNQWTQYSTMFVTGKRGKFEPSTYFHYGTMPWGCKIGDAGTFGGNNIQAFTGLKGLAEFYNHSKTYPGVSYPGTSSIANYGTEARRFVTGFYWCYHGFAYNWSNSKRNLVNPFIEIIYRQWLASIGATENEMRNFRTDTYNLASRNNDGQRFELLVRSYENLQSYMTAEQKDFVKSYIRRMYPTNPTGYNNAFTPYKWELVDPAPTKPVIIAFGSDTAVAGKSYDLRIIRAQAKDGDIEITASDLPSGAKLVKKKGTWANNDFEYSINWTPSNDQVGKTYTVKLTGTSNMGSTSITTQIKVIPEDTPPVLDDISSYSVYGEHELSFPLTANNPAGGKLEYSMEGDYGKVINNAWNTVGIYTVKTKKSDVGTKTIKFTVKDKYGNTSSKSAKITIKDNGAPVISSISPNGTGPGAVKNIYRVKAGETLKLTINATDPDGDELEISKTTEFPGSINGNVFTYTVEDDMTKNFPGPNVLTFKVKDLDKSSSSSFSMLPKYKGGEAKKVLLVYFEPRGSSSNHTPWAIAGSPQIVNSGANVTLNGSGSDDTDKDPIKFKWSQVSGPTVELSDNTSDKPSFTAPKVSTPTILKFYLTVTDPGGLSDVGVVRVQVNPSGSVTPPAPTPSSTPPGKVLLGDVNKDEQIDSTDYALMRRTVLNIPTTAKDILNTGDLNGDGEVNSTDCALLKRRLLNIIQSFPNS